MKAGHRTVEESRVDSARYLGHSQEAQVALAWMKRRCFVPGGNLEGRLRSDLAIGKGGSREFEVGYDVWTSPRCGSELSLLVVGAVYSCCVVRLSAGPSGTEARRA